MVRIGFKIPESRKYLHCSLERSWTLEITIPKLCNVFLNQHLLKRSSTVLEKSVHVPGNQSASIQGKLEHPSASAK